MMLQTWTRWLLPLGAATLLSACAMAHGVPSEPGPGAEEPPTRELWLSWYSQGGFDLLDVRRADGDELVATARARPTFLGPDPIEVDLGGAPLVGGGSVLARFGPDGDELWSTFATDGDTRCSVLPRGADTWVFCRGNQEQTYTMGDAVVTRRDLTMVSVYDRSGRHVQTFPFLEAGSLLSLVGGTDGFVAVLSLDEEGVRVGLRGDVLEPESEGRELALASFDARGALVWERRIAAELFVGATTLVYDAEMERLALMGETHGGTLRFSPGRPEARVRTGRVVALDDPFDHFIALYEGDGTLVGARVLPVSSTQAPSIALTADRLAVLIEGRDPVDLSSIDPSAPRDHRALVLFDTDEVEPLARGRVLGISDVLSAAGVSSVRAVTLPSSTTEHAHLYGFEGTLLFELDLDLSDTSSGDARALLRSSDDGGVRVFPGGHGAPIFVMERFGELTDSDGGPTPHDPEATASVFTWR